MKTFRSPSIAIYQILLIALAFMSEARTTWAQGYPATKAAERMKVPDGLRVSLFASEPMVRQPAAIEFDDKGRLWVIQYLQYPNPEGLKRVAVDRFSRTIYDNVPKPPPHGPKGADRITILEDSDHDGVADRSKDFVSGLNLTSGLAFGHGGVFVLQVPYLLFYADRNGDDIPDNDPEVLLTGFGMEDAHSVANSLTWGPDGWLYGLQGSTVTARIRGIEFQQGVWRYHPLNKKFELFSEGGGNMWGLDFDPHGNAIACTNFGGFIALHMVQGGYYWKQFGKHGPLHNPYAFGFLDHMKHKQGQEGHVAVGGLFYRAPQFPERFHNKLIAGDLLGHSVHWNRVEPRGSTFETFHEGDLLVGNDSWFAPTDVTLGPDGAIYVTDWHDQRTAHPDPDANWDKSNGRVYRISATGSQLAPQITLAAKSSRELIDEHENPNIWFVRNARRLLADRRDSSMIPILRERFQKHESAAQRLEAFWTLAILGGFDSATAELALNHRDADIRTWGIRLIGDEPNGLMTTGVLSKLNNLAETDSSIHVRSQIASSAKRLPAETGLALIGRLSRHREDLGDLHLPLLLWWAVEHHAMSAREQTLRIFATADSWSEPIRREVILPRLMKRYAAESTREAAEACAQLLDSAKSEDNRSMLLASLDEGLQLRPAMKESRPTTDSPLARTMTRLWNERPDDVSRIRLAAKLGDTKARDYAMTRATDSRVAEPDRLALLRLLDELSEKPDVDRLLRLATSEPSPAVQLAAIGALKRSEATRVADVLAKEYPQRPEAWRTKVRSLLLGRSAWAEIFLRQVDQGRIAVKDIPFDDLATVALHKNSELDSLVRKHWGGVSAGTPEEKLAEVRRLNNDVRALPGNSQAGRDIFLKRCATCHKYLGEGNAIGPDLTHANRTDRQFLLISLVDPSAVVRKEFQTVVLSTTDGRVLSGLLTDQNPQSVTIIDAKNERTVIARPLIDEIKDSAASLMPENLYKELTPENLRDLFSYLQK